MAVMWHSLSIGAKKWGSKLFTPPAVMWGLVGILLGVFFLPIFNVDFIADNLVLLVTPPLSLAAQWRGFVQAVTAGRVHLSGFLLTYWLQLFYHYPLLHLMTFFQVLLNMWCWYQLGQQLKLSILAWLSVVFLPLFFQLRIYHDPFLVYAGEWQFYFTLLLFSLTSWAAYLRSRRLSYGFISSLAFYFSVNAHEAYLFFLPLYVLVFYRLKAKWWGKEYYLLGLNLLSSLAAIFAAQIWQFLLSLGRQNYLYDGIRAEFNPFVVVRAFLIQVSASLPLNNFFGRTGREAMSYYPYLFREQLVVFFCSLVTLGVLFYLLGKIATHQLLELNKRTLLFALLFGVLLVCLPALPVALSAKYQHDLYMFGMKSGIGYILVYQQYFGAALILAALFAAIYAHKSYRFALVVTTVFLGSLVFYLQSVANQAAVKQLHKAFSEQSWILNQAKQSQLWQGLEATKLNIYSIHRDSNYYYVDNNRFNYAQTKKILADKFLLQGFCSRAHYLGSEMELEQLNLSSCSQLATSVYPNYFLYYDQIDEHSGYILWAKIAYFHHGVPVGKNFTVYYYSSHLNHNWPSGLFPVLSRQLYVSYQLLADKVSQWQSQTVVRNRENNSFIASFSDQQDILLDSIVPQIIHNDRPSLAIP